MEGNEGIAPVWNLNERNATGYGDNCGMWFMWIIVIFALMGGNGFGGWGNRAAGNALTQAEMQAGFNNQSVLDQLRGITYGLSDGFFTQNTAMLNGMNGLEKTNMQSTYALGSQLADNRFAMQNGFCEINRNTDSVKAEAYRNTCDVVNAIRSDGEKTRALLVANQIQELRDKLADRDRDLQSANFNLSQVAQSAAIINQLRPYPTPAYITASPYQAISGGTTTTTTT